MARIETATEFLSH